MRLIRVNQLGQTYHVDTICGHPDKCLITLAHNNKSISVDVSQQELSQMWWHWQMNGKFIQDAFHKLTPTQREFIKSGLTEEDWNKIFPPEEAEL